MTTTPTWTQRREELEARGVTCPDLLEIVRRATAGERCAVREAEVGRLLAAAESVDDGGGENPSVSSAGFVAALDCLGAAGPYGAGGPGGCSARVPPLDTIPRHQAMVGGAWDAAVRVHAWGRIFIHAIPEKERNGSRGDDFLLLAAEPITGDGDNIPDFPVNQWVELFRPLGIKPEWWAPLEPWLDALARRTVLESEAPDVAPGWPDDGLEEITVDIDETAANTLAELCAFERARRVVVEARVACSAALTVEYVKNRPAFAGRAAELVRFAWTLFDHLPWNLTPREELTECDTAIRWIEARAAA